MALEQLDGGLELLALEAIGVEPGRRDVRCRDQRDAAIEESLEQAVHQHRVGDVVDVHLVEAKHARAPGEVSGHVRQRRLRLLEPAQVLVDEEHEAVEVDS